MKKILLITSLGLLASSNLFGLTKNEKELFEAAEDHDYDKTEELIKEKINKPIDKIKDKDGNTPLHFAVQNIKKYDGLKTLKLLAENTANINVKNNKGERPIDVLYSFSKTKWLSAPCKQWIPYVYLYLLDKKSKHPKKIDPEDKLLKLAFTAYELRNKTKDELKKHNVKIDGKRPSAIINWYEDNLKQFKPYKKPIHEDK